MLEDFAKNLSTEELKQLVIGFRLTPEGAKLTKDLKDEWRECAKYAEKRRKQNWDNRKIGKKAQGVSKSTSRQERMKLPRLAEMEIEKRFGPEWLTDKAAHDYAWKTYPQFRLVDTK